MNSTSAYLSGLLYHSCLTHQYGSTALDKAVGKGHKEIIEVLKTSQSEVRTLGIHVHVHIHTSVE